MIRNAFKTTSTPKGNPPTGSARNDAMTETQTATQRLAVLQDRKQELSAALNEAQKQCQRTLMELADASNTAEAYERSTSPSKMAKRDEAKARLSQLQEQAQIESAKVAALENEVAAAKARMNALFEGPAGYEMAVTIYREAKAHAAEAEATLTAHRAQQQAAADALHKAEQASATAARSLESALDAKAINRDRAAWTKAQQAESDARTLVENLQRHGDKLAAECEATRKAIENAKQRAFQCKAAVLASVLQQQWTGLAQEAFAAALLAGAWPDFHTWLTQVIAYDSAAAKAHKTALLAELETVTALEEPAHA